ncbi:restriction endonuclease subunit S [Neisseria sp. P0009.S001]|nr:restriction endonuclease subunit S [Neisseria sp. HMSC063B05]OFR95753.1 hypothetical protein HMPREF2824_06085 [Neisseria sp. HMSC063B05]
MNKQQEPRLRFQGFAGAWEEKKIGEILSEVRRSIYLEDSEKYQLVTVKRRNEGVVSRGYLLGKDILVKNYSQLKTNDYLISKRQIIHGANGIVPSELDNAIVSNEYLVVVSNNDVRTEFLTLVSRTPSMYRKFLLSSYGVDIEKMVFNVEDWKSREITLPSLPEQTHLSLFFRRLDSQIAESRAVLEKSRQLKKAMLAKMFPANGEKIPKIRFKGFEGEWECRKFSDIAELRRGLTYSPLDISPNGIRVLRSSNIDEENYIEKNDDVFVCKRAVNIPLVQNGDILITAANGSSRLVGKHAIIKTSRPAVHGGFMLLAKTENPYFLNASISSAWYLDFIRIFVAGGNGAIGNLSIGDLNEQEILIPKNPEEQTAIGTFFRQLDETIALQSAEVEKLNQLKKGLLAAMLV